MSGLDDLGQFVGPDGVERTVLNQFGANGASQRINRGGISGKGHKSLAATQSTRAIRRAAERAVRKQAKKEGKRP